MGKFKPHKGLLKRIRITKSGKIKGRVANGSHLRSGKSPNQLRNMRKARYFANKGVLKRVMHLLGRRVSPAKLSLSHAKASKAAQTVKAATGKAASGD